MSTKDTRVAAINLAIDRGGGIMRFAEALKLSHQAVFAWKKRGIVPADKALRIEQLFDVPREDLVDPALLAFMSAPYKAAEDLL